MVILQLDEPGLFIFDSDEAAIRAIEAVDIERSLRLAYDETGTKLDVDWIERSRRGGCWIFQTVHGGRYRFVRSSVSEPLVLAEILENAEYFIPSERGTELLGIAKRLRSHASDNVRY